MVDMNRAQWDTVAPCYWEQLTETAFELGADVVIASVHEGDEGVMTDVMTPAGPADGSTHQVPLVFLSRRDAVVLSTYLLVFPNTTIDMFCPTCVSIVEQVTDASQWMYPVVFAGVVIIMILVAGMLVWAIFKPYPQVHPMIDPEQMEIDNALRVSYRRAQLAARQQELLRTSPVQNFSLSKQRGIVEPPQQSPDADADAAAVAVAEETVPVALEGQNMCAICIEEFSDGCQVRPLPCGHQFHPHCVDPWILDNCTCPLCKAEILGDKPLVFVSDDFIGGFEGDEDDVLLESAELLAWHQEEESLRGASTASQSTELDRISQLSGPAGSDEHNLSLTWTPRESALVSEGAITVQNGHVDSESIITESLQSNEPDLDASHASPSLPGAVDDVSERSVSVEITAPTRPNEIDSEV